MGSARHLNKRRKSFQLVALHWDPVVGIAIRLVLKGKTKHYSKVSDVQVLHGRKYALRSFTIAPGLRLKVVHRAPN